MPQGIAIKTPSTNEPASAAYVSLPIDSTGLVGFYCTSSYLDGIATATSKASKNFAKNGLAALIAGNPTISATSMAIGTANGINTQIPDSADFTFFVIGKSTDTNAATATRPMFIGTSNGAIVGGTTTCFGTELAVASTTGFSLKCGRGVEDNQVTGTVSISGCNPNVWNLLWGRSSGSVTKLRSETAGVEASNTFTQARLLQQRPVHVGVNYVSNSGTGEVFRAVVFNRALTDDEVAKMVAFLRLHATARGITV